MKERLLFAELIDYGFLLEGNFFALWLSNDALRFGRKGYFVEGSVCGDDVSRFVECGDYLTGSVSFRLERNLFNFLVLLNGGLQAEFDFLIKRSEERLCVKNINVKKLLISGKNGMPVFVKFFPSFNKHSYLSSFDSLPFCIKRQPTGGEKPFIFNAGLMRGRFRGSGVLPVVCSFALSAVNGGFCRIRLRLDFVLFREWQENLERLEELFLPLCADGSTGICLKGLKLTSVVKPVKNEGVLFGCAFFSAAGWGLA